MVDLNGEHDDDKKQSARRRARTKKALRRLDQDFRSYISFGVGATTFFGGFLALYALILLCLLPMLNTSPDVPQTGPLTGVHAPGQERMLNAASKLRKKFQEFRKDKGLSEKSLVDRVKADFQLLRKQKPMAVQVDPVVADNVAPKAIPAPTKSNIHQPERPGFIVLGMHRSGTSMLSGLLVQAAGYSVGAPLIGAAEDNEKGFFERIDVVLQNDEFMKLQDVWWGGNLRAYDWEKALRDKESGAVKFKEGERGLRFLNDPANSPWLQKDPRMCITLKTWIPLFDKEPAVVFTYRHPLEVALSLKKRQKFTIEHGLRLWIIYNMRAVQNSVGLCRVLSSNEEILANPLEEIQRIADDLTTKCSVKAAPRRLQQADVDKFIDPNLQHNKKKRQQDDSTMRVLEEHPGGCIVRDFHSEYEESHPKRQVELAMYKKAMKVFCDFKSGKAYEPGYEWPEP